MDRGAGIGGSQEEWSWDLGLEEGDKTAGPAGSKADPERSLGLAQKVSLLTLAGKGW